METSDARPNNNNRKWCHKPTKKVSRRYLKTNHTVNNLAHLKQYLMGLT